MDRTYTYGYVVYDNATALSACMRLNNSSTVFVARPTKPKPISASIAIKPTHFVVFFSLFSSLVSLFVPFNHCHRSHSHHTQPFNVVCFFSIVIHLIRLFVYLPIQNVYLYKRKFLSNRQQKKKK